MVWMGARVRAWLERKMLRRGQTCTNPLVCAGPRIHGTEGKPLKPALRTPDAHPAQRYSLQARTPISTLGTVLYPAAMYAVTHRGGGPVFRRGQSSETLGPCCLLKDQAGAEGLRVIGGQ